MANPNTTSLQLPAGVANGISLSQTPGAAGNLTITGSLATAGVANLVTPQRVFIASSGADSARVFTITGTNRNGVVQTDTITGVATPTPVSSTKDFLTVTQIAVDAATAGAITAGTGNIGSTEWQIDNFLSPFWALAGVITGPASVTTYTLEFTYSDPNRTGTTLVVQPQQFSMQPAGFTPPNVITHQTIHNVSGVNTFTFPDQPIFAHRLTVTAGTGLVVMESIQAGTGQ